MKIGITGAQGFIGTHLTNYLRLKENVQVITFSRNDFQSTASLDSLVSDCDTVIHLAAMNRHGDPQVIYDTNTGLVKDLISSCTRTNSKPNIIFSSSIQEERDNLYGKSKLDGRLAFEKWAKENNSTVSSLIIPNVFGPFGKPFYNSVVSTFSHQISHGETPKIHVDGELKLIYINQLVEEFYKVLLDPENGIKKINHTKEIYVSKLLETLNSFKEIYMEKNEMPSISNWFDLALFNSFRCYMPNNYFPADLTKHSDPRGFFMEIIRTNSKGQYSFSVTHPGITRGNHFHTRKAERFAVIKGKAEIKLRRVDSEEVISYQIDGDEKPAYVDIPIWHVHNITNIGSDELITLFWINESYDPENADTYFVEV